MSTTTAALPEHYVASPAFQSFLDAHLGQEMLRFTTAGRSTTASPRSSGACCTIPRASTRTNSPR